MPGGYIELFPSYDRFYDSPPGFAASHERHAERSAVETAHEAAAIADRARRPHLAAQSSRRDVDDAIGCQQGVTGAGVDARGAALRALEERHDSEPAWSLRDPLRSARGDGPHCAVPGRRRDPLGARW